MKAVIFDLDGTLVDSIQDIALAMDTVLERHGFPGHALSEYRQLVGWGVRNLVARSLPREAVEDARVNALTAEMLDYYQRFPVVHSTPYAGIPELLAGLATRNIPTAVLSNKADAVTKAVVAELFPNHPFRFVFGERAGVPRKPDPTAALEIAGLLQLRPDQIAFMGDSAVDIETARRAGMLPLGAPWGFRGHEELREAGAQHILEDPREALGLIEG